jgi:hypothetical protein
MNKIIISFPNSGMTWLRVMLKKLDIIITPKQCGIQHTNPFIKDKDHLLRVLQYNKSQLAKQHAIFLHRDPRDVVVSNYFHVTCRNKLPYTGTMTEFIRDSYLSIEVIINYNLFFKENFEFHVVTYESMQQDTVSNLIKCCNYLGITRSAAEYEQAVQSCTFTVMQQEEMQGVNHGQVNLYNGDPESLKARRGKVGGYIDYMTSDDIAYCNQLLSEYDYFERMNA